MNASARATCVKKGATKQQVCAQKNYVLGNESRSHGRRVLFEWVELPQERRRASLVARLLRARFARAAVDGRTPRRLVEAP